MRLFCFVMIGLLGWTTIGCQTAARGRDLQQPSASFWANLSTVDDVFSRFGLPNSVGEEGDLIVYNYGASISEGITAGASAYGLSLVVSHGHTWKDALQVRVDKNGRVVSVTPLIGSDGVERRWWPFDPRKPESAQ